MVRVVTTKFSGQESAVLSKNRLESLGIKLHMLSPDILHVPYIVSDSYGKNDYIEISCPLVVVTAPTEVMAVCLSCTLVRAQEASAAGYAKFETFPSEYPIEAPSTWASEHTLT